ncbi:hypothetical protein ACE01N_20185 [Saccharicrinis sp. FJH2]|uniref:hypothetical protein n=1 Tax=Saccharicrinis sp. FJH65 TaxID=3344659 RepID=UPI0035F47729
MTIEELNSELKKIGVSDDRYCLQGLFGSTDDNDKIAMTIKMGKYTAEYEVYYRERGEKHSSRTFTNETDACEYILSKIQEELTIKKVQSVVGLGGMTVNERLYATGLMDEFDRTKKKNKARATQILRILRVDEPSIKKILK